MQRRFTIIQGGLSQDGFSGVGLKPSALDPHRAGRWSVTLRKARDVTEQEILDWRALTARQVRADPFADPDFLLTAGRHDTGGRDILFAFASASDDGRSVLAGVVPLQMPHPIWGDSEIRLWHPPLAPRPVEPVFDAGVASDAIRAVIEHLAVRWSQSTLHFGGISEQGELMRALSADDRLRVTPRTRPDTIPAASFVEIHPRKPAPEIECVTDPAAIRDAVERFLLVEAQRTRRPLVAGLSEGAVVRVVTRLFAQRGMTRVELGRVKGEIVSAALRLGQPGREVLWRSVDLFEPEDEVSATVDLDISLLRAEREERRPVRPRLLAP